MLFVGTYKYSRIIGAVKVEGTGKDRLPDITTEIAIFIYLFFENFRLGKSYRFRGVTCSIRLPGSETETILVFGRVACIWSYNK